MIYCCLLLHYLRTGRISYTREEGLWRQGRGASSKEEKEERRASEDRVAGPGEA